MMQRLVYDYGHGYGMEIQPSIFIPKSKTDMDTDILLCYYMFFFFLAVTRVNFIREKFNTSEKEDLNAIDPTKTIKFK